MTAFMGTFSSGDTFNVIAMDLLEAAEIAYELAQEHTEDVRVIKLEEDKF
jgi:hypothetical protein